MRPLATFLAFLPALLFADSPAPAFRTDSHGPYTAAELKKLNGKDKDEVLQWYQLVEGQFPPEGSAHAVSGELIRVDHLERRFQIRVDRNDGQDRGHWDLPLDAAMLPYGSIFYHGAPAALQDIPLGTHLHGLFYWKDPHDTTPLPDTPNNRQTPESGFRRCFRLEDDFSHHARQEQLWKIESLDLAGRKLTATLYQGEPAVGGPKLFDLLSHTLVWKGEGIVPLESLEPGQTALFNLTWVTLYGPGRITDIWLDESARRLATAHQRERHRNHIRERGLAGWVDAVDDEKETVTVTFFDGLDEQLLTGWRTPEVTGGALAVARESLLMYDPVNDRKSATILEVRDVPVEPGSSGVQMHLQMSLMLEGYRPKRIVRFYPSSWPVVALPREEQFFGRE